jgi:PAS domain S-box-containing protein
MEALPKQGANLPDLMTAIVQSSEDAIISKLPDNVITSWNPAAEALFGYTAGEAIGRTMSEMIIPDQQAAEEMVMDRLRNGEKVAHYDARRIAKDGRVLDLSLTASAIRDSEGNLVGVSKVVRDITDKKKEEKAAREKEEKYRLALETARIGTWSYDPASSEIIVSSEVRRLYRFPEDLQLDLSMMDARIYPDDTALVGESRGRAFDPANDGRYEVEHRIITYEGKEIKWIRVKGRAFFDAEGKPEKLFGTFLDVTEERMAKEQLEKKVAEKTLDLQKMNEQLSRSNEDLEQFAYVASHDLQGPLRRIHSFVDIIRLRGDKATLDLYLDKIIQSTNRMSTLIRDVLEYSRLGHSANLVKPVDLNVLLEEVKADYEDQIHKKECTLKSNQLPVVMGIPIQLRQLFANLISNSLKFCEKSPEVTITGRLLSAEASGKYPSLKREIDYVELVFTDNGIGFKEEYADRMFVLFQRLHSRSKYEGTGVGLALVKKIVGNHGGFIRAESKKGKGAVITVLLPVKYPL